VKLNADKMPKEPSTNNRWYAPINATEVEAGQEKPNKTLLTKNTKTKKVRSK
jgi:hypothetical protein